MQKIFLNDKTVWDYVDGVDFCPLSSDTIITSYTKEEFANLKYYPKTNKKYYWIKKDGVKIYLSPLDELYADNDGSIYSKIK